MVATIYTVCQNDAEDRFKQNDNGQRDYRRLQRRTGDKNKGYFYLGSGRRSGHRKTKTVRDNDPNKMYLNQL